MVNGTFATDSIVTGGRRPAGRGAGVVALADQPVGRFATEANDQLRRCRHRGHRWPQPRKPATTTRPP